MLIYKCRPPPFQCEALEREGALLQRICHPNVVRVLGRVPLKQGHRGALPVNALVRATSTTLASAFPIARLH